MNIVGSRVSYTCGYVSPIAYVQKALGQKITGEYFIGNELSDASESVRHFGPDHYKSIGPDKWKTDHHQWKIEHVWLNDEQWVELRTKTTRLVVRESE